jgi:hypothetical protein
MVTDEESSLKAVQQSYLLFSEVPKDFTPTGSTNPSDPKLWNPWVWGSDKVEGGYFEEFWCITTMGCASVHLTERCLAWLSSLPEKREWAVVKWQSIIIRESNRMIKLLLNLQIRSHLLLMADAKDKVKMMILLLVPTFPTIQFPVEVRPGPNP